MQSAQSEVAEASGLPCGSEKLKAAASSLMLERPPGASQVESSSITARTSVHDVVRMGLPAKKLGHHHSHRLQLPVDSHGADSADRTAPTRLRAAVVVVVPAAEAFVCVPRRIAVDGEGEWVAWEVGPVNTDGKESAQHERISGHCDERDGVDDGALRGVDEPSTGVTKCGVELGHSKRQARKRSVIQQPALQLYLVRHGACLVWPGLGSIEVKAPKVEAVDAAVTFGQDVQ
eukprot:scaffold18788_cov62-Phaeocystis_antarctica.AAC.4